MAAFSRYLKPDLAVLTAITPESMKNFFTMEAVAAEEITAINMSKLGLINRDDIDGDYARYINNQGIMTYGSSQIAENRIEPMSFDPKEGFSGRFYGTRVPDGFDIQVKVFGEQILRAVSSYCSSVGIWDVSGGNSKCFIKIRPTRSYESSRWTKG